MRLPRTRVTAAPGTQRWLCGPWGEAGVRPDLLLTRAPPLALGGRASTSCSEKTKCIEVSPFAWRVRSESAFHKGSVCIKKRKRERERARERPWPSPLPASVKQDKIPTVQVHKCANETMPSAGHRASPRDGGSQCLPFLTPGPLRSSRVYPKPAPAPAPGSGTCLHEEDKGASPSRADGHLTALTATCFV